MIFFKKNIKSLFIILFALFGLSTFGQNNNNVISGNVTFISSENIYVQFVNTDDIKIGDTIFISKNDKFVPVMVVKNKSSISCVGISIGNNLVSVSNQVFAKIHFKEVIPTDVEIQKAKNAVAVNDRVIETSGKPDSKKTTSSFDGRVSLSSFLNNTSDSTINSIFRFNLALNANHIGNSGFSASCNLSFTNRNVNTPFTSLIDSSTLINFHQTFNDIRIYDLSVKYDFSKSASLLFGRNINPNLANIGAVDGLQFENDGKYFSFGAVVGSRPDLYTYAINPNLLQFGAFVSHHNNSSSGNVQTSLAFFNQTNNMLTDRRFMYIQHSNSLLKNVNFFGSAEIDLFSLVNNLPVTKLNLTSAYLSIHWRTSKQLSLGLSYDARKNIYYYETYKNYIDSLLDKETRQGLKLQLNYRPFNNFTLGGNGGYRFATATYGSSLNGYAYLTINELPLINSTFTLNATALKTSYISGMMYEGALSRDFANGKFYIELSYQYVDYTFNTTTKFQQNIGDLDFSWRLSKKLILSADLEASIDTNNNLQSRAFINLTQRF
jgi:hypothetical protein